MASDSSPMPSCSAAWFAFGAAFARLTDQRKEQLRYYLTPEEQQHLARASHFERDPLSHPLPIERRIAKVHYSWLIPFLESFRGEERGVLLSALEGGQAAKLRSYFKMEAIAPSPTLQGRRYLLGTLYHYLVMHEEGLLPLELLPVHPLNALLDLSKHQLQRLVDHLGLHDLAIELKRVIQTKQLKKIEALLTPSEKRYLHLLSKSKEPLTFSPLYLDEWNGEEERLRAILHQRGFNRLGKALFGCHSSLLWHLCHLLDTGRSKMLKRFFADLNNEGAQELLRRHILQLIPILREEI